MADFANQRSRPKSGENHDFPLVRESFLCMYVEFPWHVSVIEEAQWSTTRRERGDKYEVDVAIDS